MNGKRLLLMAVFGALATVVMPSAFATTITNTITVKWNTQSISTLTVVTNYSNSGGSALQGTGAPTIGSNLNSGTGSCTATGAGSEVAQVANFGNVTPDGTSHYTDCLYLNGANAFVASTDRNGYSLGVTGALPSSGAPNPYVLCLLSNGGSWANNGVVAVSTRTGGSAPPLDNGANTCATAGTATVGGNSQASNTGISLVAGTIFPNTAVTTAGTNFGGDIELAVPALATSGGQSVTITYTLTLM
jgi:hypothetical protein